MNTLRASSKASTLLAAGAALAVSALSPDAAACGGFFCSRSPVDQTAEHILFTVNDDQTVTAYVQIKYAGDKDDFAWIVPAPGIPKLDSDLPDLALNALATATDPAYFSNACYRGGGVLGVPSVNAGASKDSGPGVTVLASQAVGPFNTVTLMATDANVLVEWLQTNNFRLTTKMIPILQPYVESGMNFVAVKLQANKEVKDIQPLGMTYDANKPMIPIRLTAIAAQPEMGIVTWVLGAQRFAPENYIDLNIPDKLIKFDQYGNQNNYLTLVSSETDKVGGQAFVTEYAKPTTEIVKQITMAGPAPTDDGQKAQDALLGLLGKFPYITRLYARMSAEEMTDDPTFMVSSKTEDVDNIHDLSDPNAQCGGQMNPLPVDPCTFNYCGRRGVCVTAKYTPEGGGGEATSPACACANDAIARVTTTGAYGQPAMYCEPVAMDLSGDAPDAGSGVIVNAACEGFDCGTHGACVPMNGNPTCQCEGGYAAVVTPLYDQTTGVQGNKVTCQPIPGPVPPLPRLPQVGSTKVQGGSSPFASSGGCAVAPSRRSASSAAGLLAMLGLALTALRRRRA